MSGSGEGFVIESQDYETIRQRLMTDPIVLAMAQGLSNTPSEEMVHPQSKTPRFEFMQSANEEYRKRLKMLGREDDQPRHIGAVAETLIRLLGV
jgi:hypothetical protein